MVQPTPAQIQEDPILEFFAFSHLPGHLQHVSEPFATLAVWVVESLPRNAERTTALRKLLEAKDCAVRAKVAKEQWGYAAPGGARG